MIIVVSSETKHDIFPCLAVYYMYARWALPRMLNGWGWQIPPVHLHWVSTSINKEYEEMKQARKTEI